MIHYNKAGCLKYCQFEKRKPVLMKLHWVGQSNKLLFLIMVESRKNLADDLPPSFKAFAEKNGIDLNYFYDLEQLEKLPRFIRVNPHRSISQEKLQEEIGEKPDPVSWIPGLYAIPSSCKISHLNCYEKGMIYGIELGSAAVVMALNPAPGDHILDMCCAPGAKLCFIADLMKKDGSSKLEGSLTGVDISEHRLNIARSLLKKYGHENDAILYNEDGRTFSKKPPSASGLYDKIVLDAECTHDGSVKHLIKFANMIKQRNKSQQETAPSGEEETAKKKKWHNEEQPISNKERKRREAQKKAQEELFKNKKLKKNEWDEENFDARVMDAEKVENITKLQEDLFLNCITLVKPGGYMIYSTCSFTLAQNEELVEKCLKKLNEEGQASQNKDEETKLDASEGEKSDSVERFTYVLEHPFSHIKEYQSIGLQEGKVPNTVRFDPKKNQSGGMFVSKIRKLKLEANPNK